MKCWGRTFLTSFASLRHLVKHVKFRAEQNGRTGQCCSRTSLLRFCFEWFSTVSLTCTEHVGRNVHFHVLSCYQKLCRSLQGTARQASVTDCHGSDGSLLTGRDAESFLFSLDFSLHVQQGIGQPVFYFSPVRRTTEVWSLWSWFICVLSLCFRGRPYAGLSQCHFSFTFLLT